jgi:nitroimidazol reductase NimA-like FMN-containing flavoprotein (pyridoxamine 5'-phosphate oxidase superfamily)
VGFGRLRRVDDPAEKAHGLEVLMRHYGGEGPSLSEVAARRVTVLCLEISEVTGKASSER